MPEIAKPVPAVTPPMVPFLQAEHQGELEVQRCAACGASRFPAREICARRLSCKHDWARVGGRGEMLNYNVRRQGYHPAFADEVSYAPVMIRLNEGSAIMSNLLGVKPDRIRCEMPVEVVFEKVNNQVSLSKFRPRAAG